MLAALLSYFRTKRTTVKDHPVPSHVLVVDVCVLIVEDCPVQLLLHQRNVRRYIPNATIDVATNGPDALTKMSERRYDVVFCDLNLPLIDGVELGRIAVERDIAPRLFKWVTASPMSDRNPPNTYDKTDSTANPFLDAAIELLINEVLLDGSVRAALVAARRDLERALDRGDGVETGEIVHRIIGWTVSLRAHNLQRACLVYRDTKETDALLPELDAFLEQIESGGDGSTEFGGPSSRSLDGARRIAARSTSRMLDILRASVPLTLLQDLISDAPRTPRFHTCAAVVFVDLVDSTAAANRTDLATAFETLQKWFRRMDELAARYRLAKIRTIGDCFLGSAGVLEDYGPLEVQRGPCKRARDAVRFARRCLFEFQDRVRIGIHLGPFVSSFVGHGVQFDLFGPAVNLAARLERTTINGTASISEEVLRAAREDDPSVFYGLRLERIDRPLKGYPGLTPTFLLSRLID